MKITKTPYKAGKIWLRVEADDGRFLINVCQDDAHADACVPILERILERERPDDQFEAGGWRRRLPL